MGDGGTRARSSVSSSPRATESSRRRRVTRDRRRHRCDSDSCIASNARMRDRSIEAWGCRPQPSTLNPQPSTLRARARVVPVGRDCRRRDATRRDRLVRPDGTGPREGKRAIGRRTTRGGGGDGRAGDDLGRRWRRVLVEDYGTQGGCATRAGRGGWGRGRDVFVARVTKRDKA